MPDRIIRGELLESEPWLELKDNADRSAWIAALLTVDNFGDMPANPHRLCRLWTPYGINTVVKASHTFTTLADVDLLRGYEVDAKPYLHIPRFRQQLRWVGSAHPLSPWASDKEKQLFAKKYLEEHKPSPEERGGTHAEVKRSEVKRREKPNGATALPDWMTKETWQAWREHRTRLRVPMTDRAEALMLASLERYRIAGYLPTDLLNEAMLRGWRSPVDPKGRSDAPRPVSQPQEKRLVAI